MKSTDINGGSLFVMVYTKKKCNFHVLVLPIKEFGLKNVFFRNIKRFFFFFFMFVKNSDYKPIKNS